MAKIRGIKPDLWTDEDFVELSPYARLLWLGMWNYACDNGHIADKSKQIKMRILPTDDVNCAELLRELEAGKLVKRGEGWITIPNLTRHQKPDRRYFTTCEKEGCTPPPETVAQRESRRAHPVHTSGTHSAHGGRTVGAHVDGDGDGEVMVKGSDGEAPAGKPTKRASQLPNNWKPNDGHASFAANNALNLTTEVEQFTDHHRAKGSAMKDWDAAFRTWLRNAVKWRKEAPSKPRSLPNVHQLERPPDGLSPAEYDAWEAKARARRLSR